MIPLVCEASGAETMVAGLVAGAMAKSAPANP